MRYVVSVGDEAHTVDIEENGHERHVVIDGKELHVDWRFVGASRPRIDGVVPHADHYSLLAEGHSYEAYVSRPAGDVEEGAALALEVMINGRPYLLQVEDERARALASIAGGKHVSGDVTISAPMPGLVTNVLAEVGTEIARGQTVIVLEAMKMENDLTAPRGGIVKHIAVSKGQAVNQGQGLAVIGDPEGAPSDEDDESQSSPA